MSSNFTCQLKSAPPHSRFKSLLSKHKLRVIVMVFTDGPVAPGEGLVFGGPYPGFSRPSQPGETDKKILVENHIRVFKEQVLFV